MPRPTPEPQPDAAFELALRMAREGHYDQAVTWFERERLETEGRPPDGRDAAMLGRLARMAEEAGQLDAAERALELATDAAPDFADLQCQYASVLLARGRRAEARRALERALRTNPRYREARVELAMLDAREGRIADALETLGQLAGEGRVDEPGALQRGMERLEQAEWEEASALIKRALRASDPRLEAQLARFDELMASGEAPQAAQVLRAAVGEHENYPDLHFVLGKCELQMGLVDDALESLARALELNPDYHAARVQLARALDSAGETAQALDQLSLVLEHEPENVEAVELRALWDRRGRRHRGVRSESGKVT